METERLYLRKRTRPLLDMVLDQPIDVQLEFFGFESETALENEIIRVKQLLANDFANSVNWDILIKENDQVVGNCGFHQWFTEHKRAEIGYYLHEAHRGKGYMKEAMDRVIAYGFEQMQLNRIEALISPDNLPSQKLIHQLAFVKEGLLREHYHFNNKIHDSEVYSLLRSEYDTLKANPPQLGSATC